MTIYTLHYGDPAITIRMGDGVILEATIRNSLEVEGPYYQLLKTSSGRTTKVYPIIFSTRTKAADWHDPAPNDVHVSGVLSGTRTAYLVASTYALYPTEPGEYSAKFMYAKGHYNSSYKSIIPDEMTGSTISITVLPATNCSINDNGTWKGGNVYINDNGTWKEGKPYVNVNGTWKEGL